MLSTHTPRCRTDARDRACELAVDETRAASRDQILELEWKVPEVLRTVECGEVPQTPARGNVNVMVWRNRNVAHCRELDAIERDLLAAIAKGISFADMCDRSRVALKKTILRRYQPASRSLAARRNPGALRNINPSSRYGNRGAMLC